MTSFSERLEAAKSAARPTRDVTVTLDSDLSARREVLAAALDAATLADANDKRLTGENPAIAEARDALAALEVGAADALLTLRFTRLSGDKWAEITARCPLRLDAPIDRQYGYNMHAVCKLAAPLSGVRVDGAETEPLETAEWVDLFDITSGHEFGLIVDAIYELNEYEPAQRVAALKKELATRPA